MRWEYLAALHASASAVTRTGWVPPSALLSPASVPAMGWLRAVDSATVRKVYPGDVVVEIIPTAPNDSAASS